MKSSEVLEVIKSAVMVNVAYIDKVIVVCSGRIEGNHVEAIKQCLEWLLYTTYREKFVFIYNKSDRLTDAEKLTNLAYMCNVLGADPNSYTIWESTGYRINRNLALAFPPEASYDEIRKDHTSLTDAALAPFPRERIPLKKSACVIL